jgi:hypothetical protein
MMDNAIPNNTPRHQQSAEISRKKTATSMFSIEKISFVLFSVLQKDQDDAEAVDRVV